LNKHIYEIVAEAKSIICWKGMARISRTTPEDCAPLLTFWPQTIPFGTGKISQNSKQLRIRQLLWASNLEQTISSSNRKNFSSKGTSRNSQNNSTVLDYIGGMGNWVVIYKSLQTCLSETGPERKVQVFRETTTSMGASERYTLRGFRPGHDDTLPTSSNPAQNLFFFPFTQAKHFRAALPGKVVYPPRT
jgi:hypothetical protein